MSQEPPTVAGLKPAKVELKKGEDYYYCSCGKSANQPFCDGSHAGTGMTPLAFTAEEDGDAFLCQCKQTGNPPFCDGTHARLPQDKKGEAFQLKQEGAGDKMPEPVPTPEEPTVAFIHQLAREGLDKLGHHGPMAAMGVPRDELPTWPASATPDHSHGKRRRRAGGSELSTALAPGSTSPVPTRRPPECGFLPNPFSASLGATR
jgi:CDGSH-type Zn-finger protein